EPARATPPGARARQPAPLRGAGRAAHRPRRRRGRRRRGLVAGAAAGSGGARAGPLRHDRGRRAGAGGEGQGGQQHEGQPRRGRGVRVSGPGPLVSGAPPPTCLERLATFLGGGTGADRRWMEVLLPVPVRVLMVVAGAVIGGVWNDANVAQQLAWGLNYAALI